MTIEKIKELIARKNENLEEQAVSSAKELIDEIVQLTEAADECQRQIVEKREQLKALRILRVDDKAILGE